MADKTAPPSQLRLEWVYGYRGNQCRNNLFYNADGEAVYFAAGIGVVHDVAQKKQRFFKGQSDDILCLALHPNKELVATGQIGKDPYICIWNSKTMETVSILQGGHERGVATVAFSSDGEVSAVIVIQITTRCNVEACVNWHG
jgi:WD40 repeat protein